MNIIIDIIFVQFSHEYHADIILSHDNIKYISSPDLYTLLEEIKFKILEYSQGIIQ